MCVGQQSQSGVVGRARSGRSRARWVCAAPTDRLHARTFHAAQVLGVMDAMPSSNLRPENEEEEQQGKATIYRTTYMFSATMPPAVERLARKYLRRPVVVTIGSAGRATDNVTQRVVVLKDNEKAHRLEQELEMVEEKRAIVFANTKEQCNKVHSKLESLGYRWVQSGALHGGAEWRRVRRGRGGARLLRRRVDERRAPFAAPRALRRCAVLHSGRSQDQREEGIKGFREDKYNVLIATDVAGRGIDVPDVALVINYDMPHGIEAYTHRIGRTGRAGKKGTAITFLTMVRCCCCCCCCCCVGLWWGGGAP